jgi:hypothetical protein
MIYVIRLTQATYVHTLYGRRHCCSLFTVLKQGVEVWNQWRRAHLLDQAILIEADLE